MSDKTWAVLIAVCAGLPLLLGVIFMSPLLAALAVPGLLVSTILPFNLRKKKASAAIQARLQAEAAERQANGGFLAGQAVVFYRECKKLKLTDAEDETTQKRMLALAKNTPRFNLEGIDNIYLAMFREGEKIALGEQRAAQDKARQEELEKLKSAEQQQFDSEKRQADLTPYAKREDYYTEILFTLESAKRGAETRKMGEQMDALFLPSLKAATHHEQQRGAFTAGLAQGIAPGMGTALLIEDHAIANRNAQRDAAAKQEGARRMKEVQAKQAAEKVAGIGLDKELYQRASSEPITERLVAEVADDYQWGSRSARSINRLISRVNAEIDATKIKLVADYGKDEIFAALTVDVAIQRAESGALDITGTVTLNRDFPMDGIERTVVDGALLAKVYSENQEIGGAYLNLPVCGLAKGETFTTRGICIGPSENGEYRAEIAPHALWVMEA